MSLHIDPETLLLEGFDHRASFSAAQFGALTSTPPPCPVCGAPVEIDRIDVTYNEADELAHGRTYIPGMWHCPYYCNPRTGERYHGGWRLETGADGWRYVCSCGLIERGSAGDQGRVQAIHAEHGGRRQ